MSDAPATTKEPAWRKDWNALVAIWKRIDPWASKDIDITVSSEQIREMAFKLADERDKLRSALVEARAALATLDHMNGKEDGLAVFRNGKPIKTIIDAALGVHG